MDRTKDYADLLDEDVSSGFEEAVRYENKFYDTILSSITEIGQALQRRRTYAQLLMEEHRLNDIIKNSPHGFVVIDGTRDEKRHYDGIRKIIDMNALDVLKKIQDMKVEVSRSPVRLRPELPTVYSTPEYDQALEDENQTLVQKYCQGSRALTTTRQRLAEIEAIQNFIHAHLGEQNERIDGIVSAAFSARRDIGCSEANVKSRRAGGRLMRRVLFCLALSLAFVLCVSHACRR